MTCQLLSINVPEVAEEIPIRRAKADTILVRVKSTREVATVGTLLQAADAKILTLGRGQGLGRLQFENLGSG